MAFTPKSTEQTYFQFSPWLNVESGYLEVAVTDKAIKLTPYLWLKNSHKPLYVTKKVRLWIGIPESLRVADLLSLEENETFVDLVNQLVAGHTVIVNGEYEIGYLDDDALIAERNLNHFFTNA